MKVLVTGAAGQVGRALSKCAPKSIDYIGMDRLALDLSDEGAIIQAIKDHKPDWVINCGAITSVEFAEVNRDLTMAINATAPKILASELEETGGKLLQLSTDYVFDGRKRTPYKPSDPVNPLSVYGESKVLAEESARRSGIVLRTSWVHSADGSNFVTWVIQELQRFGKLLVDDSQIGSPTHAGDLAHAIWQLIKSDAVGTIHYSDDGMASRLHMASEVAKRGYEVGLLSERSEISVLSEQAGRRTGIRPRYCVLGADSIRRLLHHEPRHWRQNLLRTVDELAYKLALNRKTSLKSTIFRH